jgi:hypothetical protein
MMRFLNLGMTIMLLLGAQPPTSPKDRLNNLRQQARAERAAGQNEARLSTVLTIEELLHHSASALESSAAAYTALGDTDHALASLQRVAAMGEADDRLRKGEDSEFMTLHPNPRYRAILEQFADNERPVANSALIVTVSDPGLVTEDIDFDASTNTFLVTSVLEKKIVRISKRGAVTDFAASPSGWPMFALKIDVKRQRVWATEVAPEDFVPAPKAGWGRSALLCYSLRTGRLLRRIAALKPMALGDMVLLRNGSPVLSDGTGGGIYELKGDELVRIDRGDFISPQTPALLSDDDHILVPDYLRGIAVLVISTGDVRWLDPDGSARVALNGIDGLYRDGESLLLTQNGTTPERISRIYFDAGSTSIKAGEVIERGTATLGDPTHGVIVGRDFYYLTNSGWSELDDNGNVKSGGNLTGAYLMRFQLR